MSTQWPRSLAAPAAELEGWLSRYGFWAVLVFGLVYYALYYDTGLQLTGEQGSNALLATRILEGKRPIADTFLGYNLMWFYPIAAIFKFTGTHWLAMRIYFLLLALITGLMGFCLVRRVTGQGWLAVLAAVFMILMPGMIFRNYMGFLAVLASVLLVRAYVLPAPSERRQIAWMAAAGGGLALCFLIRIEPGLLLGVIWLGLTVLFPLGERGLFVARLRTVALGTAAALAAFAAVHAPFVIHSYQRGFGPEFVGQYTAFIGLLRWELEQEIAGLQAKPPRETPAGSGEMESLKTVEDAGSGGDTGLGSRDGRQLRPSLSSTLGDVVGGKIYFLNLAIWFPPLMAGVLVLTGAVMLVAAMARPDSALKQRALVILVTTGCALTLFPQYFFFRPDAVHLGEFMVPFWPAILCSGWMVWEKRRTGRLPEIWAWTVAVLVTMQMVVSFNGLFGRAASGSIRSARGLDAEFRALNGVRSRVKAKELSDWEGLRDAVLAHSLPGENVVTFPYVPIVNVMCNRPSYQWMLYTDNATATPGFLEGAGKEILKFRPAVIVINDRAINRTEFSRFRNWAAPLYTLITENYMPVGSFFEDVEVYALPEKMEGGKDATK